MNQDDIRSSQSGEELPINDAREPDISEASVVSNSILSPILDVLEIFVFSIAAVLMIFSFFFRLCRVDGTSMLQTLNNGERLVTTNIFYEPQQGDIIVFHLSNETYHEPLVKRVIATEGQKVRIDFTTGEIFVDGKMISDEHAYISNGKYNVRYDFNQNYIYRIDGKTYFEATVPSGKLFVMGDNRNGSADSRCTNVGFIDRRCVLGKAIFRISPFTVLDR